MGPLSNNKTHSKYQTRQVDQMRLGGRVEDSYTYNLEDRAPWGQECATIFDHQALFSSWWKEAATNALFSVKKATPYLVWALWDMLLAPVDGFVCVFVVCSWGRVVLYNQFVFSSENICLMLFCSLGRVVLCTVFIFFPPQSPGQTFLSRAFKHRVRRLLEKGFKQL